MRFVYKLLLETMIFGTVVLTLDGVDFDQGIYSFIIGGIIFGLMMYGIDPVLNFFRFPKNFWGYLVIGTIFSLIYFVILHTFVFGILNFGVATLGGTFGPIEFPSISLESELFTVIFTAIYAALFSLLMEQLGKSR